VSVLANDVTPRLVGWSLVTGQTGDYCGQTTRRMEMSLEIGLDYGHIVLDRVDVPQNWGFCSIFRFVLPQHINIAKLLWSLFSSIEIVFI